MYTSNYMQHFSENKSRWTILALYYELTDNDPGRYRYEHDIEDVIRPSVSANVIVPTPTKQIIACKFGITEKEDNVWNWIVNRKCFHVYRKEYERSQQTSKML